MSISHIILIAVLSIAVVTDLTSGKIKNWLTLPAIVIGPAIAFASGGSAGLLAGLAGIGVMIVVVAVLMSFGLFGGGDAKLLVAVGSLGGLPIVRDALLYTGVAGGILALIFMIWRKRAISIAKQMAVAAYVGRALPLGEAGLTGSRIRLPYALAIAAGTVAAIFVPL